jgi:hypothetical protein
VGSVLGHVPESKHFDVIQRIEGFYFHPKSPEVTSCDKVADEFGILALRVSGIPRRHRLRREIVKYKDSTRDMW